MLLLCRGNLAGLNNEYTAAWKKQQEAAREKRHTKERLISLGEPVSSDDDEWEAPLDAGAKSQLSSSTTSPNFVPAASTAQPSYLPMTPQKPHNQSHHTYTASPQHDFHSPPHGKLTPSKPAMHRNQRYSHDYS